MSTRLWDLLHRLSPGIFGAMLTSVGIMIAVVIMGNQILGVARTFVVSGHTTGALIEFSGDSDAWSFAKAAVCEPRSRPARASSTSATSGGVCDSRRYDETATTGLTLNWGDGSRVDVRRPTDGPLEILLENEVGPYPAGTLIFVPAPVWQEEGALAFKGSAQLGKMMASGNRAIALSGKYEVREAEILTRIMSEIRSLWSNERPLPRSVVVNEGQIFRGEVIRVVNSNTPHLPVGGFGHITSALTEQGFNLVYISPSGDHALEVSAIGTDTPARIRPTWLDTASTSPTLIVIVIVLSILANAAQAFDALRKTDED